MAATPQARITGRSEYLKKVLAPAIAEGEAPDVFSRYALELNENDPQVIAHQIDFVVKLWRNSTTHEKYGELIRRLLKDHPDAELILKDPSRRQAARNELLQAKRTQDRAGLEQFASLIAELRDGTGALPESTRSRLLGVGVDLGLADDEIARRLATERFVDDIGVKRAVLEGAKFKAITTQLNALRGQVHAEEVGPTLFSFIGAPFSSTRDQLKGAYGSAAAENDKRPFGDEKTLASRVLVDVRRYLVDGDPDLYRNAVIRDAKDSLRERIQQRKALHGHLDGKALQSFVADAVRRGLDEKWANNAIRELAREERLAIDGEGARSPQPTPPQPPRQPPPPVAPRRPDSTPPVRPTSGPRPPVPPVRPQRPGPAPPIRPGSGPKLPVRPGSAMPTRNQAALRGFPLLGWLVRALQQRSFRTAPYWWLPSLVPVVGAALSWLWASIAARRWRYLGYSVGWWIVTSAAASAGGAGSAGGALALVWGLSLWQVLKRRKSVRDEIRMHTGG